MEKIIRLKWNNGKNKIKMRKIRKIRLLDSSYVFIIFKRKVKNIYFYVFR